MKLFARWNTRTKKLAPLGDLIGYPPYLYVTKDKACTAIFHAGTIEEESAIEVEILIPKVTRVRQPNSRTSSTAK